MYFAIMTFLLPFSSYFITILRFSPIFNDTGNGRELESVLEYAFIQCNSDYLETHCLPSSFKLLNNKITDLSLSKPVSSETFQPFENLLSEQTFLLEGNLKRTSATVVQFLRSRYKKLRNKEVRKISYFIDEKEFLFSIRYEKVQDDHLVNYIIKSKLQNGKEIRLIVDGPLCPFATTGIIMITSGAYALDFDR